MFFYPRISLPTPVCMFLPEISFVVKFHMWQVVDIGIWGKVTGIRGLFKYSKRSAEL